MMKHICSQGKQLWCLLLALLMLTTMFAGCGSSGTSGPAASTSTEQDLTEIDMDTPDNLDQEDVDSDYESTFEDEGNVRFTGEVIDAAQCADNGYDVAYGMFDYETYLELPLVDQPETLTYWMELQPFMLAYNNFETSETTFFREMEARTGVHLDITAIPVFSSAEQFSLMVAGGEYSDMLEGASHLYNGGGAQLLSDEIATDLLPYEDIMPNYIAKLKLDPAIYNAALTMDGQLAEACAFTGRERNDGPQLRGDWMEALGLELPVTYDDYHDVLTALKNEYGATLWLNTDGSTRECALSAGYDTMVNEMSSDGLIYVDGEATYCPATENYREFLQLMNQWWNEGLIYPDFVSQSDDANPDSNLILNGNISMWVGDSNNMAAWEELSSEITITPSAFPVKEVGQEYKIFVTGSDIGGGGTAISTTCQDVELACRWLDYLYTYEGFLLTSYGAEGEGLEFNSEGEPQYSDLVLNNDEMIVVACSVMYSKYGGAGIIDETRFTPAYSEKQVAAIELWNEHLGNGEYVLATDVKRTEEETAEYAALYADISTYAQQCSLMFITGTMSLEDDWAGYLESMEALGLEDFLANCQTAYERTVAIA